jgi:hypothetical protein
VEESFEKLLLESDLILFGRIQNNIDSPVKVYALPSLLNLSDIFDSNSPAIVPINDDDDEEEEENKKKATNKKTNPEPKTITYIK